MKNNIYDLDNTKKVKALEDILMSSNAVRTVLERSRELNIDNYYVGAGCITQTVWNYLSGNSLEYGIKDIDFVYFDDKNMDTQAEEIITQRVNELLSDIGLDIDVKNEAHVHLWYESNFGYPIKPYESLEAAINTWPTTATAIGIRFENDELKVYSPFGLDDLFGKIVRANKMQITKEIYDKKIASWIKKWPDLKVIPW